MCRSGVGFGEHSAPVGDLVDRISSQNSVLLCVVNTMHCLEDNRRLLTFKPDLGHRGRISGLTMA